jgi:hypothetical protein
MWWQGVGVLFGGVIANGVFVSTECTMSAAGTEDKTKLFTPNH